MEGGGERRCGMWEPLSPRPEVSKARGKLDVGCWILGIEGRAQVLKACARITLQFLMFELLSMYICTTRNLCKQSDIRVEWKEVPMR